MSKKTVNSDYLVGIDLGTTHCAVAFADCKKPLDADNCQLFEITQLVGPSELSKRPLLPCFRYHPLEGEIAETDIALPWGNAKNRLKGEIDQVVIGEWARELGSKAEGRLVNSAKSWLCQKHTDADEAILPWQGHDDAAKVSPVHACASFLHHIAMAWNHEHPHALLHDQEIIITIPASFDESARQLTLSAAKQAGLEKVYLIEEPQAVCYRWFTQHQQQSFNEKLLLICDIGGGTTDLSLVQMTSSENKSLALKRVGVGEHLMLGGDNIDLLLAATIKQSLHSGKGTARLRETSQLLQQTRIAKERLFSEDAPESAKVTLLGGGSRLIARAKSAVLDKNDTQKQVLDGFFPITPVNEAPHKRQSAIQEVGLPFESDPAISRHIANFIMQHQTAARIALGVSEAELAVPDAVLFNGGIFNSSIIKQRLLNLIENFGQKKVSLLDNPEPDLAVAKGAVAYALARKGFFDKITGGSARSFFLLLKQENAPDQAICLLPHGTEENHPLMLEDRSFSLTLGKQVRFDLLSSTSDQRLNLAELIQVTPETLEELRLVALPPLMMAIEDDTEREVEVKLVATYTDIGTLEITCVSPEKESWQLAFTTRQSTSTASVKLPKNFDQAIHLIDEVYGDSKKNADPKAIKSLRNQLEKRLGKKEDWDLALARAIFDELLQREKKRRRSVLHEKLWFNLAGFSLRPGFGHNQDNERLQVLWPMYSQGLQYQQETQSWIDWWTFWRRASGGLDARQQQAIFNDVALFFDDKALNSKKIQQQGKQQSVDDIIKLVANLEHLGTDIKTTLVNSMMARIKKNPISPTYWWAIGRIASRQPVYCHDNQLESGILAPVIHTALNISWEKNPHAAFASVMLSRKMENPLYDIGDELRQSVIDKLLTSKQPKRWINLLADNIAMDEQEQKRLFGEALPQGLSLIN